MDEAQDDPDTPSVDEVPDPAPDPVQAAAPIPAPAVPVEAPGPARRPSRRWFVAGAAAAVVGGAAGVAFDFARGKPAHPTPQRTPPALRAALADERALLSAARAARQAGSDIPAGVLASIVRDHEAHLVALSAAAAAYPTAEHPGSAEPPTSGDPGDRAVLHRLEQHAAQRSGRHARQLTGDAAALLASIAACEATHAELLT